MEEPDDSVLRPVLEAFLNQNRKLITQALANGHTDRNIAVGLRKAGFKASPEPEIA